MIYNIEKFDAKTLHEISAIKEKEKINRNISIYDMSIEEKIKRRIKLAALMGRYFTTFYDYADIEYIQEHKKFFESIGFIVTYSNIVISEVEISW